ncbi:MAG: rhodanese-like domain-containing protein [Candidatus Krumholzibacteriia bacterium]
MTATTRTRRVHPTPVTEALRLVGAILAVGIVTWLVRPDRLPLRADAEFYALDLPAPLVSVDEARAAYDEGRHVFIDTRPEATLANAIPGAFVIRAASFAADLDAVREFIFPEDPLILYGEGSPVPVGDVAVLFQARGHTDVRILQGGLEAWRAAGGPVANPGGATP